MMLRAVPGLTDFRPGDANETAAAWRLALERTGPSFFALTRQDLPVIDPAAVDVYGGVLAADCSALLTDFFERRRV